MGGKLYVVGTPIGNLGDMSPRAVETLEKVDFIAAEDTRVTVKLLNHFEIKKEMLSYYEHNKNQKGNLIIERMLKGESCAVVSDAGMPAISDPGEDLVRKARESGIEVESVPGPSALITAISISGFPCGRFCFEGFLSMNKISRRSHLEELKTEKRTMVFYEAPHKLPATLKDMLSYFGDRKIVLVRELTKIHETVKHWTLKEAAEYYSENAPKGEFVLIVEGFKGEVEQVCEYDHLNEREYVQKLIEEGITKKDAIKIVCKERKLKKDIVYKQVLDL